MIGLSTPRPLEKALIKSIINSLSSLSVMLYVLCAHVYVQPAFNKSDWSIREILPVVDWWVANVQVHLEFVITLTLATQLSE